jgi:DNA-binding XRE family transcriptional regulator
MCGVRLPGYNKKTNHFVLPVSIQFVDNKQKLKDRKFVRTKFLKRQIYGYFYNNLRIDKSDKLTRKELNESFRKERIHRSKEYKKLMEANGWSKADLARHLGVSRAWVTMVMREVG